MLFTSLTFALFLPTVFLLHWFACGRSARLQNLCLIAASCLFYGWWNWRFLLLVGCNIVADYLIGLQLGKPMRPATRKLLLGMSITVNLSLLGFFKYFDFFIASLNGALAAYGVHQFHTLRILLPLAISYYTLQTMSYSIDVYKRSIEPASDFPAFAAYILFFPKLLAGPIERAGGCLPQFLQQRAFDRARASDGLRQILWGVAKKVVVADACAGMVDKVFLHYGAYNGSTLLLGAVLYAFQIYADFSGYSDIAIGLARLFGIRLTRNFAYPYFAKSVAEFWQRWHISLSTWLRDFLFLPLSYALARRIDLERWLGIRIDRVTGLIATPLTFLTCGLWHGASLTFAAWGLLHGLYLIPQIFRRKKRMTRPPAGVARIIFAARGLGQAGVTFLLVTAAWIIFRSDDIYQAAGYLGGIVSPSLFAMPQLLPWNLLLLIGILTAVEWLQRERPYGLDLAGYPVPKLARWLGYSVLIALIVASSGKPVSFIYFRF